jgi:hypothetical protein
MELLTIDNPKTNKGSKDGYLTAVLHLAPHKLSGTNVCPHATDGCATACLNTAGRGGMGGGIGDNVQRARVARTKLFHADRAYFMEQIAREIEKFEKRCKKLNMKCAVRLNGTSDLPWEKFPLIIRWSSKSMTFGYDNIFQAFPDIKFYDYTKWPLRLRQDALDIKNYTLCFSLSEHRNSDVHAVQYLEAGCNVAVVMDLRTVMGFRREADPMPETFLSHPVVDGDESDLRFLDPPGHIVGLRAKGRAIHDTSGFVRHVELTA